MLAPTRVPLVRRSPPPDTGSKAMRYFILALVTATLFGAYPLIRWYRISEMKAKWAAEDEARERSRGNGKRWAESIKEQLLRQQEARRWEMAEYDRNRKRRELAGTRPPGECAACEGLGLIKVTPPPEKGKAEPSIADCENCRGAGVATKP